jgi:4-diphosphocytidyl-2-C-methyl-D-erythritol kinase
MTFKAYRAVAKVNIFLKITGTRGHYHEILSRFMRIESLYDTLCFREKPTSGPFNIVGDFTCKLEQNTIYKVYKELQKRYPQDHPLHHFFLEHDIMVDKQIPTFAGLGGGSSDAATFLLMCNEQFSLGLSQDELYEIGLHVGADLPFFLSGYSSANVSGIGEIVEPFDEEPLALITQTPELEISTPRVYKSYREHFFNPLAKDACNRWAQMHSHEVLHTTAPHEANDLFRPALKEYPALKLHVKSGWFFSGSGSTFFKEKTHG